VPSKKSEWKEPSLKDIRAHRGVFVGYREGETSGRTYAHQPSRVRYTPKPQAAKVDTCRRGHPFTPANTIQKKEGGRKCRTCFNAAARARKAGG